MRSIYARNTIAVVLTVYLLVECWYIIHTRHLSAIRTYEVNHILSSWKTIQHTLNESVIQSIDQKDIHHNTVSPHPLDTNRLRGQPHQSTDRTPQKTSLNRIKTTHQAVLFTMDSITSYETNSAKGGAAGELLIRHSLEQAFRELGIELAVKKSDIEFIQTDMSQYDIIIVDPWTWASKGWVPKKVLVGQENKVYVLDFFGSKELLNARGKFNIPPKRLLTAFGSPWNTFLGYYMNSDIISKYAREKKPQGVIWGKDPKHYKDSIQLLQHVADTVSLHSTATRRLFKHKNVVWHGHQTVESWMTLLAESRFLIGLGDPLLGPSAIDAIAMGCVYINPIYDTPVREVHKTQHDYAVDKIGAPYVCNAHLSNIEEVLGCVKLALKSDLKPFIPRDFSYENYIERVRSIFLK